MSSSKSHTIKRRNIANDVFYTPLSLSRFQIEKITTYPNDKWFDPFRGLGSYYDQFPTDNKDWTEITDNRDFFLYDEPVDIICSNPPYSIINDVFKKSVSLNPRVISFLIGQGNLTPKRIEFMNSHGYSLTFLHLCKVFNWYGISYIVQFEKNKDNCISYDRTVWR